MAKNWERIKEEKWRKPKSQKNNIKEPNMATKETFKLTFGKKKKKK